MYTCGNNDSKHRKQRYKSSPSRRPVDDETFIIINRSTDGSQFT